jgi:hypothetical protein
VELVVGAEFETRRDLAEQAVAVARRVGDDKTLVDSLIRTHEAIHAPETLAQRVAWMTEACEIADRIDLRGGAQD